MMSRKSSDVGRFALAVGLLAVASLSQAATERLWSGSGDGTSWSDLRNWYPEELPTQDDIIVFNKDATVSVDTGIETKIWGISVTAGSVKLDGTAMEGSVLRFMCNDAKVGYDVAKGAKLDLSVPVVGDYRMDKHGAGELWFHAAVTNNVCSYIGYGSNVFARGSSVYAPAGIVFGLGKSDTGLRDCAIFTDDAKLRASVVKYTGSANCSSFEVELDGDDVDFNVYYTKSGEGDFIINNGSTTSDQYLLVKRGKLTVTMNLKTVQSTSYAPGHFIQTGGTVEIGYLQFQKGEVRLEGGTFYTSSGANVANGCVIELAGGSYGTSRAYPDSSSVYIEPMPYLHISGDSTIFVPQSRIFSWNFDNTVVAPGTRLTKTGPGSLQFCRSTEVSVPLTVAEGTANIASGVTLTAPRGATTPWALTIKDGAKFSFTDITSRLSLPIDLAVEGTGQIVFPQGNPTARGLVVAHSFTLDGQTQGKGRYASYNASTSGAMTSALKGSTGASIVVPYVWNGQGNGTSFSDGDNWVGGVVPPSGRDTPVDLSAADVVEASAAQQLASIVVIPPEAEKTVTFRSSAALTLDSALWYSAAAYVKKGCRLVIDADVDRGSVDYGDMSLIGGGVFEFKGNFPGMLKYNANLARSYLPFSVDGEVVFSGTTQVTKGALDNNDFPFLMMWTHESEGVSSLTITDGANVTGTRLYQTPDTFNCFGPMRQTGGTVTFGSIYLNKYTAATDANEPVYRLEGGELTVNGYFGLGYSYSDAVSGKRQPGGSFIMTGGTLNQNGTLHADGNRNYIKLLGGTVNLGGNIDVARTGTDHASWQPNADVLSFGGVEINVVAGNVTVNDSVILTGQGGDTVVHTKEGASGSFSLSGTNKEISGPGGLTFDGGSTFSISQIMKFTGGITMTGPYYCYLNTGSTLDGPTSITVTDANAKFIVRSTILKNPDTVSLAATKNLTFEEKAKDVGFTVKRLFIGGVEKDPGTYAFTGGNIVVLPRETTWLDGTKGDLSTVGDSTVAEPVTLSSLRYAPYEKTAGATLSGESAVTLDDAAVIEVAEGRTLTVAAPVVLAGTVRKIGLGTVVFTGAVTSALTPGNETGLTDRLVVEEGEAHFDGAVTGVGVYTCSTAGLMPAAVFTSNCTLGNYAFFRTAWSDGGLLANGETRIEGAAVDLSGLPVNSDLCVLTKPNGGKGRLVIDGGSLTLPAYQPCSFVETAGEKATFEIVQNDGTFILPNALTAVRAASGQSFSYTLNGGTLSVGGKWTSLAGKDMKVAFNGGTIRFAAPLDDFLKGGEFAPTLGGTVALEQASSAVRGNFSCAFAGVGSFVQKGPGTVRFAHALPLEKLAIENGTVELAYEAGALEENCELEMSGDGMLGLLDGVLAVVNHATANGVECVADDYVPGPTCRARLRDRLAGSGTLRVKTGEGPGFLMIVR